MDVIKNRKIYRLISSAIIIVGLIMFFVNGLNYGIEFTGGTLIQINMDKFINVDTRIITATNGDIETMIEKDKFRRDFYHRINTFIIEIPPLRERPEDIEP